MGQEVKPVELPEITKVNIRTYIDPVLADLGTQLMAAREVEARAHQLVLDLERRERVRIERIFGLGPLRDLGYPNVDQRALIDIFESSVERRNPKMLGVTYALCMEKGVHKTNYLYEGREPIMAAYARLLPVFTEEKAKAKAANEEAKREQEK